MMNDAFLTCILNVSGMLLECLLIWVFLRVTLALLCLSLNPIYRILYKYKKTNNELLNSA